MLAQEDDDENDRAIYYLSKRFHNYETRYTPIEKSCFTLVWAVQKLRHIVLPFQIWVVARMDSLKYLFEKPTLCGRLSRWLILLAKFDLKYEAKKTIVRLNLFNHVLALFRIKFACNLVIRYPVFRWDLCKGFM